MLYLHIGLERFSGIESCLVGLAEFLSTSPPRHIVLLLQPDKLFSIKKSPAKTRPLGCSAGGILTRGPCSLPRVVLTAVAGRCANAGSTRNRSSSHEVQPDLVIPPSSYDSRPLSLPPGLLHAQLQQRRGRTFANLRLPTCVCPPANRLIGLIFVDSLSKDLSEPFLFWCICGFLFAGFPSAFTLSFSIVPHG